MKRYLNQLECKILRAGDSLFNTTTTDNLLIFVFSGKLIIYSQEGTHIAEVAKIISCYLRKTPIIRL